MSLCVGVKAMATEVARERTRRMGRGVDGHARLALQGVN